MAGYNKQWYPLDLSAIVYPTLQRKDFSSVYRLSMVLKEAINPRLMQEAIDMSLSRFPTYKVAMRKGLFWRYFEPNNRPGPFLEKDVKNFCMPMHFHGNHRYLLRFYYYENRISMEAHHSLGDGNGGMSVLTTIVATYLRLQGKKITYNELVLNINDSPDPEELEDAYMRYSNKLYQPKRNVEKAYLVRGTKEEFHTLNVIGGIISTSNAKEISARYHATITEYLNSVLIYALLKKQKKEFRFKKRPVKIAMPINLRRFFPSKSLRNFITMIYPSVDPRLGDYSFEEIIKKVHHYMQFCLEPNFLMGEINTNAAAQRNPIARISPLFIKDFVVSRFYQNVQDKNSSAGLTNMGVIHLPKDMEDYVERFDIYMGIPFSTRTNCAIISYKDTLTINFASCIVESDVERYFFKKLVEDGIDVTILSNRS